MRRISLLIAAFDPPTPEMIAAARESGACLCVLSQGVGGDMPLCSLEHRSRMAALLAKETGALLLDKACFPSVDSINAAVENLSVMMPGAMATPVACDAAAAALLGERGGEHRAQRRAVLEELQAAGQAEGLLPLSIVLYIAQNDLYLPDDLPRLSRMLTENRLLHTLSVKETAVSLAGRHHVPVLPAWRAAMLHDCVKCMPFGEMLRLAKEAGITDPELLSSPALLHAPLGAWYAEKHFGVTDRGVLDAIATHTLGAPGMTPLQMCVLVADMIEPRRRMFPGLPRLRALAQSSLPEAALECLKETERYVLSSGGKYSAKSRAAMAYLAAQIK